MATDLEKRIKDTLEHFGSNEGADHTWESWVDMHTQELVDLLTDEAMLDWLEKGEEDES